MYVFKYISVCVSIVEAPRYCGLVLLQTVRPSHVLGQPILKPCPEIKSARRLGLRHPGWSPIATPPPPPQKKKKKQRSVACQKPFIFDEIRLIARILIMIPMITVRSLKKLPGSYPSCYPSWQFDCWKSGPMQCPVAGKDHWCGTRSKLLEKSRGNKIIPTSAPQLGWTDIGREPRLWSNVYILSFVYTYMISFCL